MTAVIAFRQPDGSPLKGLFGAMRATLEVDSRFLVEERSTMAEPGPISACLRVLDIPLGLEESESVLRERAAERAGIDAGDVRGSAASAVPRRVVTPPCCCVQSASTRIRW